MAQINPRTFAEAKQLGDGIYELILTNWGNFGLAKDPNNGSISYPPVKSVASAQPPGVLPGGAIPLAGLPPSTGDFLLPPLPSLAGIAIAPRSDIDKCILTFTSLPQIPAEKTAVPFDGSIVDPLTGKSITIPEGFVNYGGYLDTEQVLSVGAPLIGQLLGPIVVRAHWEHWFTDSFLAQDPAGTDTFGTALNTLAGQFFWTPKLRLLLYFTSKMVLPPIKRAPFFTSGSLLGLYPAVGPVFISPVVVPIMGRQHVTITVRNKSATPLSLIVGGTNSFQTSVGSTAGPIVEEFYYSTTAVAAGTTAVVHVDRPAAPFMTLMATGGLAQLDFNLTAVD